MKSLGCTAPDGDAIESDDAAGLVFGLVARAGITIIFCAMLLGRGRQHLIWDHLLARADDTGNIAPVDGDRSGGRGGDVMGWCLAASGGHGQHAEGHYDQMAIKRAAPAYDCLLRRHPTGDAVRDPARAA